MANFTVTSTSGQLVTQDWLDEGPGGDPASRLNAPRQPRRYHRITGPLPVEVPFVALVGGAVLLDAALGGNLFSWWWSHRGEGPSPAIVQTLAGRTSVVAATFRESNVGTWLICAYRPHGGSVLFAVSVEP
jgi:hypothetical protein